MSSTPPETLRFLQFCLHFVLPKCLKTQLLIEIISWSSRNVFRRVGVCWGAQALLKVLHNVEKHSMDKKLFGVYDHNLNQEKRYRLMQGFIDRFPMPVSRYTKNKKDEIIKAGLEILAFSASSGVGMVRSPKTKD